MLWYNNKAQRGWLPITPQSTDALPVILTGGAFSFSIIQTRNCPVLPFESLNEYVTSPGFNLDRS